MASSATPFEFVIVTSSSPTLSAESRGLIKKHVMKDIGLARRKYMWEDEREPQIRRGFSSISTRRPALSREANYSKLAMGEEAVDATQDDESLLRPLVRLPQRINTIGTGCLDPFNSFPVQDNVGVDILVRHINDDSHASFKLFREYWFPISLQDPASFHCTLAFAAYHRMTMAPGASMERCDQKRQYTFHYASAISLCKERVGDPTQNTGDELIAAIILLVCDPGSSNSASNYVKHMNGLETIIALRGGVETLELNKSLRLLLFWIDTIGSSVLGLSPRFPAPTRLLPKFEAAFQNQVRPRLPCLISREWAATFPWHSELISIFDDLCALTSMVENEALQPQADQEPRFTGFYILPLVHRLFTLKPELNDDLYDVMVFEACKLGAFLYLQNLRYFVARRYPCLKMPFVELGKAHTESLAALCVQKLDTIMLGHDSIWTTLLPLKCWVINVCHNSSFTVPSHVVDLALLASSPFYDYWCSSVGILMGNSWTYIY